MLSALLATLLSFVFLAIIWFAVSLVAYEFSKFIKKAWPIQAIAGISMLIYFVYGVVAFIWYFYATYSIFKNSGLIWALLFFFFLGGIFYSFFNGLVGLIASIPMMFVARFEERVEEASSGRTVVEAEVTHRTSKPDRYNEAFNLVVTKGKASTALFQRELQMGYAEAARIMEALEDDGVVGPADGAKPRKVNI